MKMVFLKWAALCVACSLPAMGAPGQSGAQSENPGSGATQSNGPTLGSSWSGGQHLRPTGRFSGHSLRAREVIGAEIRSSRGEPLGKIQDLILDPSSGKINFVVVSLEGKGAGKSPSGEVSGSGSNSTPAPGAAKARNEALKAAGEPALAQSTQSNGASAQAVKLVPVPWSLVQPVSSRIYGAGETAGADQYTFTANVQRSRVEQAPSLGRANWSEINQPEWRERIDSYYGLAPGSSMGGAQSPSGSQSGVQRMQPETNCCGAKPGGP
jgi:sporulation protein YlmC with PRC-barrel domain